jgi:uncharacterized membrane protein
LRRLLKFLHTLGAIGFMGAMACLLVLITLAPQPTAPAGYAQMFAAMADILKWIFLPSLVVTVIAGLLAIAVNYAFHEAGWAWIKAATGILIFEGGLHILGPIEEEAKRSAGALAAPLDPHTLAQLLASERNTLWVLLAVAAANVALGVWRPRLPQIRVE